MTIILIKVFKFLEIQMMKHTVGGNTDRINLSFHPKNVQFLFFSNAGIPCTVPY